MNGQQAKRLRKRMGMNQKDFWARLSVGQSGGSRYESGRALAKPVQVLAAIAYGTQKQRAVALKKLGVNGA